MTVFLVQGPSDRLVQLLERGLTGLGDVAQNGVDSLALVVTLLTLNNVLGGNTTLGQIDVTCITI